MLNAGVNLIPNFVLMILCVLQGSSCGQQNKVVNRQNNSNQEKSTVSKEVGQQMNGKWGGLGIAMEIGDRGGTVEFDCAHGTISEKLTTMANVVLP